MVCKGEKRDLKNRVTEHGVGGSGRGGGKEKEKKAATCSQGLEKISEGWNPSALR